MVKNLIAQAVSNLLENAVKYSDTKSTIVISAERATVPKVGEALIISVRSTGLPIKPDENELIFQRGFRGSTAKQKVPAGTGIGLYLAKRVMALHQGLIGLGTNGRDSRFKLIFPLSRLV